MKYPVIRAKTDRVDVEVIGPSEALDLETECGSGLCQQLAGDFLFHCHVAHHYVAGMWGYWRVYNTIQQGDMRNDVMPDLRELPDRKGRIKTPISSDKLIGQTVDWFGTQFKIIEKGKSNWKGNPATITIKDWVEMQLPTAGKPGHKDDEKGQIVSYDATVLDWTWNGNVAMSEKESTIDNPKYKSTHPGKRHPIMFEPLTGKVAWPHLTPHFGKRVMFSPNHVGAPWLEMIRRDANGEESVDQATPGEQGNWSLCPVNAGRKSYNVHFIKLPIKIAKAQGKEPPVVDPNGLIYVLHEEEAAIRANDDLKYPLVVRGNIYDCVDWTLTSEWDDDDYTNFQSSKINTHWHFLQFDNQASDGVITGFSYEQSVRPFTMLEKKNKKGLPAPMNTVLTAAAKKGANSLSVKNAKQYHVGTLILVGADNVKGNEISRIKAINGNTITLAKGLKNDHPANDIVTVEFVRQRFWVDADVGTVFWHDHAFGATTWPHGGFGTFIAEPVGSTYHDPKTGKLDPERADRRHPYQRAGGPWREQQLPRIDGAGARHRAAHRQHRDRGQSSRTAGRSGAGGRQDRLLHDAGKNLHDADAVPERRNAYHRQRLEFQSRPNRAAVGDQSGCLAGVQQSDSRGPVYAAAACVYRATRWCSGSCIRS